MKPVLLTSAALLGACALMAACSPASPSGATSAAASSVATHVPVAADVPAGAYDIDPAHASLTFKVNHMGFSHYTARFAKFDAHLTLDPAHPEAATLSATIDPKSLELNTPPKGFHDELMGKSFFEADKYPTMSFTSTKVEKTGDATAKVTGNMTMHGVTKPVTLDVTFNGGYPGMAMDPHARVGFSATGTLNRADFGMGFGVPAPGSTMGVGNAVDFTIDAEFTGPALKVAKG